MAEQPARTIGNLARATGVAIKDHMQLSSACVSLRHYVPKAPPVMRMVTPMLISAAGSTMWPQRDNTLAMTGRDAKYLPAAHQMATPIRNTAVKTEMVLAVATAKIGM